MNVVVNGRTRQVLESTTIADVVAEMGGDRGRGRGVAVARNGEVVRRAEWTGTVLEEDDRVEVLGAIGGG
jgi:sulfur carrier protein